jgi:hypothetical protein
MTLAATVQSHEADALDGDAYSNPRWRDTEARTGPSRDHNALA